MRTRNDLKILQSLPLECKIALTEKRILEAYKKYGSDLYVSFSGGKDSTVLLTIARKIIPNIKAVFSNTGLEYPEIVDFVKSFDNVEIIKPKYSFKQIIDKYGYPVISKEISTWIENGRNGIKTGKETYILKRLKTGECNIFQSGLRKYEYLINAPFDITSKCCYHMKKAPLKKYCGVPLIATLATESMLRTQQWLKNGCNAFDSEHPKSMPLSFWNESDILEYLYKNNIDICSVYGDIVYNNGKYELTGVKRTGCMFCMYGVHLEKTPNRFQRMAKTHPLQYRYCMEKLELKAVLDYIGVEWRVDGVSRFTQFLHDRGKTVKDIDIIAEQYKLDKITKARIYNELLYFERGETICQQ